MTFVRRGLAVCACVFVAACADRLPDQDLRILQAVPVAKLNTDLLWKDYQADARAANKKYWGKAIEITGKVSEIVQEPPNPHMSFSTQSQPGKPGIEARLLDERVAATVAGAAVGQRITLRCFCEGIATNVILKSCIKP